MSDNERGAYSPQNDAPLAFDARRSPGGGGFPTTLIISLVILALLIVAIVMFYRSGIRSASEGPAPVGTPVAQIKSPAPAGAQPSDEATGLQIYKTEGAPASSTPSAPTFSAPPEEPKPRPVAPSVAAPSPAIVAASGATGPARPAVAATAAQKDEIGALLDKSSAVAAAPPKPAKAAKAAKAVKPAAVAATPALAPAAPAAPAVAGASAQIGAYSSDALAAKGWGDIAGAFPADMAGKGKHFEPVAKDGKTLYRAAVTGFASKADAQAFCAKLKAAGHACIVK
jgi:hypothetical protein